MKHYSRARGGVGPYSELVTRRHPGPEGVAAQVSDYSWRVIDGTVQERPNRCRITDTRDERLMIWGPTNNLRTLIWAGLNSAIDGEPAPAIVVTTLQGQPFAPGERRRHILQGQRADLDVFHTAPQATIEAPPDHAARPRDA